VPDEPLTSDRLDAAFGGGAGFGVPHEAYPVAVSVDSIALSWVRQEGAPEGSVVAVETELSGRGRRGTPWVSVAGGTLAFAVLLRPELPVEAEGLLWPLASLAAAEGASEASGVEVALKWPNDLLAGDRRLGLVDVSAQLGPGRIDSAVLTVRLNATLEDAEVPDGLRDAATSLTAQGGDAAREDVLAGIVRRLEVRYGGSVADLLDAYRERCATLGRRVRAEMEPAGEVAGVATDVDGSGRLVVDDDYDAALPVEVLTRLVEE
jgi:BirA family biotin operon repressor/biotin-[acetyl-CoA-carboxylase] ligase